MILLCEDRLQASLVRQYIERCELNTKKPCLRRIIASEMVHGGNVAWVLREFPRQLDACRKRQTRAKTLLIVVADADRFRVDERHGDLNRALKGAELEAIAESDPQVILIPQATRRDVDSGHDRKTYERGGRLQIRRRRQD